MVARAVARAAGRGGKRVKNMSQRMSQEMGKTTSTPTQRAFGGGRKQGLKRGRKEGAVVGGAAGVAVGALTASEIKNMSLSEMEDRLKKETRRADSAENATERAQAEANAAKLQVAIEKAVAKANNTGMKGNNTRGTSPRPRLRDEEVDVSPRAERNERREVGMAKGGKVKGYNAGGAVSRKGSFDYRKGGLFK
jgi:hypothetical protein